MHAHPVLSPFSLIFHCLLLIAGSSLNGPGSNPPDESIRRLETVPYHPFTCPCTLYTALDLRKGT